MGALGDKYYGAEAETYDAQRCHSPRWAHEQIAVNDWVFSGPVLDVPLGTGRYIGIYQSRCLEVVGVDISEDMLAVARKNYPGIDARKGSVLSLPFEDETFGTVVCTRLLDWLPPEQMQQAVSELKRMANIVVVTIRHGKPEFRVNYTHDINEFYRAIDGLFIDQRRFTEVSRYGVEEIFRLRKPVWADVLAQFNVPNRLFTDPEDEVNRISEWWVGKLWPRSIRLTASATVEARYVPIKELSAIIETMAQYDPEFITTHPPHNVASPVTILSVGEHKVLLDGRKRANSLRGRTGLYPALVVSVPAP